MFFTVKKQEIIYFNGGINNEYRSTENILEQRNGKIHKWSKGRTYIGKDKIVNHSKNIIDLIEVGDYVNGEKVKEITKNYITVGNVTLGTNDLTGIKSIATKEQYKSVEYVF